MPQTNIFSYNSAGLITGKFDYDTDKFQLFLNDSSVAIRFVKPSQTRHKTWYHKHIDTNIFKVATNKHGEKYLVTYVVSGAARTFWRQSVLGMSENRFLSSRRQPILSPLTSKRGAGFNEMGEKFAAHLSKLLGIPFDRRNIHSDSTFFANLRSTAKFFEKNPNYWDEGTPIEFFSNPFMRSKTNRDWLVPALVEHDKVDLFPNLSYEDRAYGVSTLRWYGKRGLSYATIHSKTVDEFIGNMVYKSYLKSDEDLQAIKEYPLSLGVLSNINLHMGAKQAIDDGYIDFFRNDMTEIPYGWGYVVQFLLSALPISDAGRVMNFMRLMAEAETTIKKDPHRIARHAFFVRNAQDTLITNLKTIPVTHRRTFAKRFFAFLEQDMEQVAVAQREEPDWIEKAAYSFERSYALVCVLGAVATDEVKTCLSTAKELFGVDLSKGMHFKLVERADPEFAYFNLDKRGGIFVHPSPYGSNENYKDSDKVLKSLLSNYSQLGYLAKKVYNPALIKSLEVMGEKVSYPLLPAGVEASLKKAAEKIDVELERLGVESTPQNRFLYLTLPSHLSRYKINWKFFLLGITGSEEIALFKKAGILSKRELSEWGEAAAALPRDMYAELVRDAVGEPSALEQPVAITF